VPSIRVQSRFLVVDGICAHYLDAGAGETVFLRHSGAYGTSAELSSRRSIPALAERCRVVAPDWLGFGLTGKAHDCLADITRDLGGLEYRHVRPPTSPRQRCHPWTATLS
jgi:2-hydroxymuconate-semialdehyde hydrolase